MFTPHVLYQSARSFREIRIKVGAEAWTANADYDLLVESEWARMRAEQSLWDGTYYRTLSPTDLESGPVMQLGTIDYRYIATYRALHRYHARWSLPPLYHLSTIALIRTSDGRYVFGRRSLNGSIDLIGGGVQCDELPVSRGADLERNLYKEILEETGIAGEEISDLRGLGALVSSTSNVLLLARVNLRISKARVRALFAARTDNEMAEPIFVQEARLSSFLLALPDYRALIPEVL